jgi:hypothetical protein
MGNLKPDNRKLKKGIHNSKLQTLNSDSKIH